MSLTSLTCNFEGVISFFTKFLGNTPPPPQPPLHMTMQLLLFSKLQKRSSLQYSLQDHVSMYACGCSSYSMQQHVLLLRLELMTKCIVPRTYDSHHYAHPCHLGNRLSSSLHKHRALGPHPHHTARHLHLGTIGSRASRFLASRVNYWEWRASMTFCTHPISHLYHLCILA